MKKVLDKKIRKKIIENIENSNFSIEKTLKAKELKKEIETEPIDFNILFLYGCPSDYYEKLENKCKKENRKPKKCKECTMCWIENLTINPEQYEDKEALLKEYKDTKLTPKQIKELLTLLNFSNKKYETLINEIRKIHEDYYKNKRIIN